MLWIPYVMKVCENKRLKVQTINLFTTAMCLFERILSKLKSVKMPENRDRWTVQLLFYYYYYIESIFLWSVKNMQNYAQWRYFTVGTDFFSLSFWTARWEAELWFQYQSTWAHFAYWEWSSLVWFPGFSPVSPVRGCLSDDDAFAAPWNPPLLLTDSTHKDTGGGSQLTETSRSLQSGVWMSLGWGRGQRHGQRGKLGVLVETFPFSQTYIISLVESQK